MKRFLLAPFDLRQDFWRGYWVAVSVSYLMQRYMELIT